MSLSTSRVVVQREFTSGTLTIAPPSDWDLLPRKRKWQPEAGPSRPVKEEEEEVEVVVISSDDSLPDDVAEDTGVFGSTRSSAEPEVAGDTLHVPLEHQHDRLRRVIRHPPSSSYSFVSMRSQVEQFEVEPEGSFRLSPSRHLKTNTQREGIDDACLLSNGTDSMIITGHVQDAKQISAIMIDPSSSLSPPKFERPLNKVKKGGVSALTTMLQPLMFASGGYDHLVHLWDVKPDFSAAHPRALSIKHNSVVQALLSIRDSSHKLISGGADCSLNVFDLASERVVSSVKTSNIVYNLHTLASPFTTLVEVAHRDLQFEVRDHRAVPRESAVRRFGYGCQQVAGRFIRGASLPEGGLFACGDREGMVRVWDMRDTSRTVNEMVCMEGQKIVQVVFHDSARILACSSNHVMLRSLAL